MIDIYDKYIQKLMDGIEIPEPKEKIITMTAVCSDGSITITEIAEKDFYKEPKSALSEKAQK